MSKLPKPALDTSWTLDEVMQLDDEQLTFQTTPWDNIDFLALANTSARIQADPFDLLLVLFRESRAVPAAATMNGKSFGIVGMNQFTQEAVIGTFYPEMVKAPGVYKNPDEAYKKWQEFAAAYVKMKPHEQFPYIAEYFEQTPTFKKNKPFVDAVQLYSANFGVSTSEITDPNYVFFKGPPLDGEPCYIMVKDEKGQLKKVLTETGKKPEYNRYCQNEGMDTNGDRLITRSDLPKFMRKAISQNPLRWYSLYYRTKRYLDGLPTKVVSPGF